MIADPKDTLDLFDLKVRPRRLRTTSALRDLVAETSLNAQDLIVPFFVVPGRDETQNIEALPGISRYSVDKLLPEVERALGLGVRAVLLFGVPGDEEKDAVATAASDPKGPVPQALREAREAFGDDVVLITDVCLCAYADHGHCGLIRRTSRGAVIDNDSSLEGLARMALAHAEAGADLIAPSDMMDGRVGYLRAALDQGGFSQVGILSYAVKFASAFYGPFREAAGSAPKAQGIKDRKSYQMDARNAREAVREAKLDEMEGADMLMVKPALAYLDMIQRVRVASPLPLAAYNVSGEYAMLKHAASAGALDEAAAVRETLMAIKRAGADLIISYHALEALQEGWLQGQQELPQAG
jgi:porphobilinogen synthase